MTARSGPIARLGQDAVVLNLPEEPEVSPHDDLLAWVDRLPPDLRKSLGEHMYRQFIEGIEADIIEVDKRIAETMPQAAPRED